jgi:hypothetical protein
MVLSLYCFLQKDCDAETLEFFCSKAKQNLDRLGMLILNTGHLHCHFEDAVNFAQLSHFCLKLNFKQRTLEKRLIFLMQNLCTFNLFKFCCFSQSPLPGRIQSRAKS